MTEPTQAQIEEAKQMRARYSSRVSLDVYTNELASIIAHIRREVFRVVTPELSRAAKRHRLERTVSRHGLAQTKRK